MKRLKFFCLLLALPCLALQCNKDDEDENKPKDVTRLSEEFKSYAYFKEGSWWVYKELNSGNLDSAYVTRSDILVEHLKEKGGGPEDYESLSMNIVREFRQIGNKDTIIINGTPGVPSNSLMGKRIEGILSQTVFKYGISGNVLFILHENFSDTLVNQDLSEIKFKDSLKIQGKLYSNVFKMKHPEKENSETNNLIKADFYAKNVGLIKRVFWDGRVKELLRYNVEQ